jgi:hypothetical protein
MLNGSFSLGGVASTPGGEWNIMHGLADKDTYARTFFARSIPHGVVWVVIEFISIKSSAAKGEDEPGMMEGTADVPHQSADAHLA